MTYTHPLHDRLLQGGWAEVQALERTGEQEAVDLDFKAKVDPMHGGLDKKDREIIAQTVSALANSMGGAVVWGVDCRSNEEGIDAVTGLKPITGVRRFASEVASVIPHLVMPRLEDVRVNFIENPGRADSGVLVVSVGRSERRPHRSEATGDKRYYKRSGSNTVQMEHFDVEDAFRRMSVAKLEFDAPVPFEGGSSGNTRHFFLSFFLRNVSNVSAKFPFVEVEKLRGGLVWEHGNDGNNTFPLKPTPRNQLRAFAGDANTVIHPGQAIEVFRLVFHVQIPSRDLNTSDQHPRWPDGFRPIASAAFELVLRVACENAPLARQAFEFSGTELEDLLQV